MSAEKPIDGTATTKDMPAVEPRPADQPAKHERSLVGFYIALGVVAALVGLGAWLYQPLRLRYAIYRVVRIERNVYKKSNGNIGAYLAICHGAALQGNRAAMDACLGTYCESYQGFCPGLHTNELVALALSQPNLLCEALQVRPKDQVLAGLDEIEQGLSAEDSGEAVVPIVTHPEPQGIERDLKLLCERASKIEVQKVAAKMLDFTRRRFARELAETEEAEKKARGQAGGTTKP